jgi:hypothetical protein
MVSEGEGMPYSAGSQNERNIGSPSPSYKHGAIF